jgi:hypothetical protein
MGTSSDPDVHEPTRIWIQIHCKGKLTADAVDWANASVPTESYNCMGYAVGLHKWWQSKTIKHGVDLTPTYHWPDGLPDNDKLSSFVKAAELMRFKKCNDPIPEKGIEKIALYYNLDEEEPEFWHAAKVISETVWDSKLSKYSDIKHAPDALDGIERWGLGRIYMSREIAPLTS